MNTNADGHHRQPVLARAGTAADLWMNPAL